MTNEEQIMQRYLLGQLSEAEQETLEQEYFNDRQAFDHMVQVENDLVDKYARGLLSTPVRERFEQYYLAHPERRERAKFAAALAAKLDQMPESASAPSEHAESVWSGLLASLRGPKLAWAFSVALLVMTAVAGWFVIESRRLRQEFARSETERVAQAQRERESQRRAANEQPSETLPGEPDRPPGQQKVSSPSPTKAQTAFASLTLTIGGTREVEAAPPATLVIPGGTKQVRLQLNLKESDYPSYRATLQEAGGREIHAWRRLTARTTRTGASFTLTIPAQRFDTGDYILTLRGVSQTGEVEDVSKSLFRVERK